MGTEEYNISGGQQGAVGHKAQAREFSQQQIAGQPGSPVNLSILADELLRLRTVMQQQACEAEHFTELAGIASAEKAAKEGNGIKALESLKSAGKWTLDAAKSIGVALAIELINQHIKS